MAGKVSPKKSSQSVFTRTVKNIKKGPNFIKLDDKKKQPKAEAKSTVTRRSADELRGVVYLSHIPPGFYEDEMRKYFNQFGHVTRIKLARSKKTGKSKGHAFIEFRYSEVAKVVAETMNNYLMCNRLLKATFMDRKYSNNFWKPVTPHSCPRAVNRRKDLKLKNSLLSPAKELKFVKNKRRKLDDLLNKLKAQGIDYNFTPEDYTAENSQSPSQQNTDSEEDWPVLVVDESDSEIGFKTPPNVIKRVLKRSSPEEETETPKAKKQKGNVPGNNNKSTIKLTKNSDKDSGKVLAKKKKASRLPVPVAKKQTTQVKKSLPGISMNISGFRNKVQTASSSEKKSPKNKESNMNSSQGKHGKSSEKKKVISKVTKKVLGGKVQQKLRKKHFKPAKEKSPKNSPKRSGKQVNKVFQSNTSKMSIKKASPSKSVKVVKKKKETQSPKKVGNKILPRKSLKNEKKENKTPQKRSPSNSAGSAKRNGKMSQKKGTPTKKTAIKVKFSPRL